MRNGFVYLVVVVAVLAVLFMVFRQGPVTNQASYSKMLADVAAEASLGGRPELVIAGTTVEYRSNNQIIERVNIRNDTDVIRDLN